ncbi:MAG: hypothetical protein SXG53_11320, partial [Pseudomonadota bacterium]|nr:hypothetical protein [Pseudomonadota bacterium]
GWSIARALKEPPVFKRTVQTRVAMWRTSGSIWTQTRVPEQREADRDELSETNGTDMPLEDLREALRLVDASSSPLQQALRRELLNRFDDTDSKDIHLTQVIGDVAQQWLMERDLVSGALQSVVSARRREYSLTHA